MPDAMVTARMSVGKKEAGATVLARLGVTPTRAINELYDFLIQYGRLPFADEETDDGASREERLARARLWLSGASLPAGDRFATMSDDDIRRERLASRGNGEA